MQEFTTYIESYEKKERNFYDQLYREIRVYLTGKRIVDPYRIPMTTIFTGQPPALWELKPTGHDDFILFIPNAPCFIHRWMQRFILGFKYKRTKEKA